jgi:hypothetical protein
VLLTVFRKTRQHDQRQIDRAIRAQKLCESKHGGPAQPGTSAINQPRPPAARLRIGSPGPAFADRTGSRMTWLANPGPAP